MVRKIERQTKLIAVRLDNCEIPECLIHIAWQDIADLDSYDTAFDRILNGIFGVYTKPPVGERPAYTRPDVLQIGQLTRIDSVIFEVACRMALNEDSASIDADALIAALAAQQIFEDQIIETQEILDSRGYIELDATTGPPHVDSFSVRLLGFDQYVQAAIPDFNTICFSVATMLVREQSMSHRRIAQELNQAPFLVEHVFRLLESEGLIKYTECLGGVLHMDVFWVSPELRRRLEQS